MYKIQLQLKDTREELIDLLNEIGGELIEFSYTSGISSRILDEGNRTIGTTPSIRMSMLRRLLHAKSIVTVNEVHNGLSGLITEFTKVKTGIEYISPRVHFGTKNEFAHVRFKTRDLNGKKVLTVEEMQSDFGIAAKTAIVGGKQVTDFPFKQNWYEMVTKRLIRYAADNGFDAVAIPKGSM